MNIKLYVMSRVDEWEDLDKIPKISISDQNLSNLDNYHLLDEMVIEIPDYTDGQLRAGRREACEARASKLRKQMLSLTTALEKLENAE